MSDTYNPELPVSEYQRRLTVQVWEFLSDWHKGDFDLPQLAQYDAMSMEGALDDLRTATKRAERAASPTEGPES